MKLAILAATMLPSPTTHHHHAVPMNDALASWYDDSSQTASGRHYTYGFASLMFGSQWGKRVRFCYRRCVTGRLDDHGPYVSGRAFDFNWALKTATGCTDLCHVRWIPTRVTR